MNLLPGQRAGEHWLVHLTCLPGDQLDQAAGRQVQLGGDTNPHTGVSKLFLASHLQNLVDSKLPICYDRASKKGEEDTLGVSIPGTTPDVEADRITNLLRVGLEDSEAGEDVVGGIIAFLFE